MTKPSPFIGRHIFANADIISSGAVPNGFIQFADAQAAPTSDLAKVDGVAYSGGPIRQYWSNLSLIVDLAGMELSPQIVLLLNHDNDPFSRIGAVDATINIQNLTVTGGVDTSNDNGKHVVESGKKYQWQLSIGAAVLAAEEVSPDDVRTINGREFKGPFIHVKKSKLREVSVVAVGADPETSLRIAASLKFNTQAPKNQGANMDKLLLEFIQAKYGLGKCDDAAVLAHLAKIGSTAEAEEADRQAKITAAANATGAPASGTPAPAPAPQIQAAGGLTEYQVNRIVANALNQNQADETARVNGITAACTEFPDLQSQAISERWTVADTQRIVAAVKIQKQKFQPATGNNIIIRNGPEITAKTLEAALSFQQGINEKTILATCGEKATEDGDKLRGITLKGVMTLCCQMENKIVGVVFDDNSIRASFTTTSLPGILSNVANKKALQNFQSQGVIATRLCSTGDLNDFKESERYRLTDMGDLQPIAADGEFKQGGLSEEKAVNQLQTFGKIITITRQMIYNDDLGLLTKIAGNLGARAARLIDQLFFRRLLSNPFTTDGKALFCADHRNFLTGTASALSLDAIKNGRTKFMQQVDKDNQPINVMPKFLLVPSALDAYAQELLTSTSVVSGATTPTPSLNIVSKFGLESISSPYLDNAAYPNSSPTGWYLFGDPNQVDTFEIGYLQGKRLPTVEHTASDFDTLGMRFRVYFDVGVREIEYRGMTFSKGVV